jgi:hypothetical protein
MRKAFDWKRSRISVLEAEAGFYPGAVVLQRHDTQMHSHVTHLARLIQLFAVKCQIERLKIELERELLIHTLYEGSTIVCRHVR